MNDLTTTNTWLTAGDCDFNHFRSIVEQDTSSSSVPLAADIRSRIPVYSGAAITDQVNDPAFTSRLLSEWNTVFDTGAGVIIIEAAYQDTAPIEEATEVLSSIIAHEQESAQGGGDHFAAAGANSRVWNAHEKLARVNAELFTRYYANTPLHLACRAWLGPAYQMTAQVNVVHPGGAAQVCHRDYHLGFQSVEQLQRYPANVHRLSPHLTLQGAIAHTTMPLESGPTQLLPYSQKYHEGYVAAQLPQFREYFNEHCVQLPLQSGDMMFFNPAVLHAAGENRTDKDRFANLLQVGSAFGRTTEVVDRTKLCKMVYPALLKAKNSASLTDIEIDNVITATAEGYAFPCNLDLTPPAGGLAPPNQQDVMRQMLHNGADPETFNTEIQRWQDNRRS
jgi:ectoine hydroxylase-related dioxygenase (phytanoyl-CoA dioxygenase family)